MNIKFIIMKKLDYIVKNKIITIYDDKNHRSYIRYGDKTASVYFYEDIIRNGVQDSSHSRVIFIIDELNESNIEVIRRFDHSDVYIITGTCSCSPMNIKSEEAYIKNILVLPNINDKQNSEFIDMNTIHNIDSYSTQDIHKNSTMMIGTKNLISSVNKLPLFIIKRFKNIEKYNEFVIYIFSSDNISVYDKCYIEDALKYYAPFRSSIVIEKRNDKLINDDVFFIMYSR